MFYFILVILVLVAAYLGISYFLAGANMFLDRQPVPKNPKDYGMNFENVEFNASDGVKISGWLIPGKLNKIIILTHVGGLTKYGSVARYKSFAKLYDKEVEFLKTAKHLHKAGYWVLMFDFRNHGESGADPNHGMTGVGLKEYKDVVAAIKFIQNRKDTKNFDIGFVSFCLGANSTIVAASKHPELFQRAKPKGEAPYRREQPRESGSGVKCMMAIQPISMEVFVRTYYKIRLTSIGVNLFLPMVKKMMLWRGSIPLEKMSPRDFVKDIKVPILYVQARNDPWTELSDIQGFYNNTPAPKEFFWIENTKHRFESYSYFQNHPEKMLEWLERWM